MRVKEVMTADPVCAAPDTSLSQVATLMAEHNCGAIPIVSDGRLVGIVTDRDITCRTLAKNINPLECVAKDVMTPRVVTVGEDDRAEAAARAMEHENVRRLPVVDPAGRVIGIVSATDLAMKAEELASGSLVPKLAHHVSKKTSARFVTWM